MSAPTVLPEWLHRGDCLGGSWTVLRGPAERGEAFTDLDNRRMRVPGADDEMSRCVRAHEMMHAKVSPHERLLPPDKSHVDRELLVHAEEFRVNQLVRAIGIPVDHHLRDGSERSSGRRMATSGNWAGLVCATAGMSGTRSLRDLLTGVSAISKDLAFTLRLLDGALQGLWKSWVQPSDRSDQYFDSSKKVDTQPVASTEPLTFEGESRATTRGWLFTIAVAELLQVTIAIGSDANTYLKGLRNNLRHQEIEDECAMGAFAPLIEREIPRPRRVDGALGRRRRPADVGRNPRHINRMLTDPERRVFDRRRASRGGVVLIDQSGSMGIDRADLDRILQAAPGCTVIGYSHSPGSEGVPNIWVIADRGRAVDTIPDGNLGNGVDGPALRFAARHRRNNDPLIWVSDGYVTDRFDSVHFNLTHECAALVASLGVHQVEDLDAARSALESVARGRRLPTRGVGPIGRLLEAA